MAEGQKGVLLTGFLKIMVPFMMMIPGVIAFHLYGPSLATMDLAYPTLVNDLFPALLTGFFLAVLLGAVLSSFNSLLNSASTMFAYDIYKAAIKKDATDRQMIRVSQWFGTCLALFTFFIAPLLLRAPDGLWNIIREFTGFFNIPIVAIVLVGIFAKRVPPIGPKIVIIFHVITYYMLLWGLPAFFNVEVPINFIHISGMLFVIEVAIMLVAGKVKPLPKDFVFKANAKVNTTPWKYAVPVSILLFGLMVFVYILFSPIGLAFADGIVSQWFWPASIALVIVTALLYFLALKLWNQKHAVAENEQEKLQI